MLESASLSRRGFLGLSAVAAGAATMASMGCTPETNLEETEERNLPTDPAEGGTWVPAACWHNCGGRCMNKVMVKDGMVVRQKTDDTHPDSIEYPQQRGCVRGKAQQQQCFGADRILHPMKRKNWKPGGGENSQGQLRGKDEWERISWDEAIELACTEIKRISDEYGPTGFYCKANNTILNVISGYVRGWDTTSHGVFTLDCTKAGLSAYGLGDQNDRFDMENAEYIIMWSHNVSVSAAGLPYNHWLNARAAGAKFITIDPIYNASSQALDADWFPVRNGTDMALMFAVIYEMMRLDEAGEDICDWDFIHKYTVGFDAESMPEDATINENLKDYILGKYDGTPKTPEWAYPICDIEPERITELARIMGKNNKVMLLHNYGWARNNGVEMLPQLVAALGALGGHMGKSGHATSGAYHANAGNGGAALVSAGSSKLPSTSDPITIGVRQPQMYELIINGGGHTQNVSVAYGSFHEAMPVDLGPIKCIYHMTDATLQTSHNQKMGIEAHRSVDFVLSLAQFMTTNARYSDIILPVCTQWETVGGMNSTNREYVQFFMRVTEPLGESKTDQQIGELLIKGMGMDPALAYDKTEEQQFYEKIASMKVMGDSGEMETLVTLTAEDIAGLKATGEPQTGKITLQQLIDGGGYQFERKRGDKYSSHIGWKAFVDDPEGSPRGSNSGKIEIYCQARYDLMASFGFPGIENYKPYPTYVPGVVSYETTFKDGVIGGEKTDYPYILYNPHYLRRSHSVFDNCPWLREAWGNPVFLNRTDATEKGIAEGDTVLVSTKHGQVLRRAALMDILRPGVVGIPHGAWVDVDEETGIDRAGSDNYLLGDEYAGMGVSGYNNYNCNFEKWTGTPLGRDCDQPARWSEN